MNERIKELAVQADLLIKKSNGNEFRYGNLDPKFQKFAELIVRECMELTKQCSTGKSIHDLFADEIIAEHFGVEE